MRSTPGCGREVIDRWITFEIRSSIAFRFFSNVAKSANSIDLIGTASPPVSNLLGSVPMRLSARLS
jgi:hypothetical protein